jgi:FemAB-related protein (PEP-CTERM system-associated)
MGLIDPAIHRPFDQTAVTVTLAADHDASEWDHFVTSHPDASGYHAWAWRGVFARAFGHESIYLIARQGTRVCGVLPLVFINSLLFGRSLTSVPFLNYGGIAAESPDVGLALMAEAEAIARDRRCGHIELRHVRRQCLDRPFKQHKVTMRLGITSDLWTRLDRKVRNQIRKAQKSELIARSGGAELLDEFYVVFARNMRDLGTPVQGRPFFEEVLRAFPDRARVHLVCLHGSTIAAGITYRTGHVVELPWASSIRTYNHLCPNHLLYWSILEEALLTDAHTVDFGRSTPHEATYKFKEQWGAEPVALHWEYYLAEGQPLPNTTPANPKFRLAIELWKRLPVPVATLLGPRIVRALP